MKKRFLVFGVLSVLVSWSFAAETVVQSGDFPKEQMLKQNRQIVKMASEGISETLPQRVDDYTTLVRVEGKGTTLIYVFEINTGAKSDEAVKEEGRERMKKVVTEGICRSSKRFLESKIDITYLYVSAASKNELFRFNVTEADCLNAQRK
jgi:hypothetical protein